MEPPRFICTLLYVARAHAKKVDCGEGDQRALTPPASGLPSAALPAEARAALALRADVATVSFGGAASLAGRLFLRDRARGGVAVAGGLVLAALTLIPGLPCAAAAAAAAAHVGAV